MCDINPRILGSYDVLKAGPRFGYVLSRSKISNGYSRMKKELLIGFGIYMLCVALARFLWDYSIVLTLCYFFLSIVVLYRWYTKTNLILYFVAFVLGPLGEVMVIQGGAWAYSDPFCFIPVWLPFVWGIAALVMKKLSEILMAKG